MTRAQAARALGEPPRLEDALAGRADARDAQGRRTRKIPRTG